VWTPSRSTAAEANPTVFSPHPFFDLKDTFVFPYLCIVRAASHPQIKLLTEYSDNIWMTTTTFYISQFKGCKSANKALRNAIIKAKGYADLDALVKDWTGNKEFTAVKAVIDAHTTAPPTLLASDDGSISLPPGLLPKSCEEIVSTPPGWRGNPDPAVTPLLPANERRTPVPAGISKRDPGTPTPLDLPSRPELAPAPNGPFR
jgi:tRNA-dihydrouridine synthase 2